MRQVLAHRPDAALTPFRAWGFLLALLPTLAACQTPGKPDPLPPTRDRNYLCQQLAPGETMEDEALCEENKHWMSPDQR